MIIKNIFYYYMNKKKTKKRDKKSLLFSKYDKSNNNFLSKSEIIKLLRTEFKLNYTNNIITSLMNIWGTNIHNKLYISKDTFIKKLFKIRGNVKSNKQ